MSHNSNVAVLEGVIIIEQDGKPAFMARKEQGGAIKHYILKEASWGDHQTMHNTTVPHMAEAKKSTDLI